MLKVAILGTVPNSRRVAPYKDAEWEIWVCSPGNSQGACPERVTRWFEIHSLVDMLGEENKPWFGPYVDWLNKQTFPIYMQERNEVVPAAIPFPRRPLLEKWGENAKRTNWFTSSIAWMMAFALHLGAKEIGIFGVDMAATEEHYSWQKAGCLRFFEIARDMGVKVTVPLESTLAAPCPVYGYAESSRHGRATLIREFEIKARIGQLDQQKHQSELEGAFYRGALEQIMFERRTWVSGQDDAEIDEEAPISDVTMASPDAAPPSEDQFEQRGSLLVPKSEPFVQPKLTAPEADEFPESQHARGLLKKKTPLQEAAKAAVADATKKMKPWPDSTLNGPAPAIPEELKTPEFPAQAKAEQDKV
jgi:hypothetical protein